MRFTKIYGQMFQSLVLPSLLAPTRSRVTSLARQIRQRQRWPISRLKDFQLAHLKELLRLAEQESTYYRQRWAELGISAEQVRSLDDFQQFPVTQKADLEANFPDGLAIASRRSAQWQYVGTRGTTRRVMVIHDFERRDIERAVIMVALTEDSPYRYGTRELSIPPDACSVHCGVESDRAESVRKQLFAMATRRVPWNRESISDLRGLVMDQWICGKTVLPPLRAENDSDGLRDTVAAMRKIRPLQFVALPEYLRVLARYIQRTQDRPPPIPVIRPMGANFPQSWKQLIENAFCGQLREHYGSRELGPMAFDCAQANGMHLLMSQHLIEVVRDGRPVAGGELGKIVVTDLHNMAMPMIRYEIGDLARLDETPCACGRTTPRIRLEGRVEDAFVLDDRRILTSEAVSNFFATQPEVEDFQLAETTGGWRLRVVPIEGARIDERELGQRFLAWCDDARPISVRTTQAIRPEASGKFRHCKSQTYMNIDRGCSIPC